MSLTILNAKDTLKSQSLMRSKSLLLNNFLGKVIVKIQHHYLLRCRELVFFTQDFAVWLVHKAVILLVRLRPSTVQFNALYDKQTMKRWNFKFFVVRSFYDNVHFFFIA